MPMYKKILSLVIALFTVYSLAFSAYAANDCDVVAKSNKNVDDNLYINFFMGGSAEIETLGRSRIAVSNDFINDNYKLVVTEIAKNDDAYSWINNIMAGTEFICYDIQIYDSENTQSFANSDLNFLLINPQLNNKNIDLYFINADGIKEKITTSVKESKISFTNNKQGIYAIVYTNEKPSEPTTAPTTEPNVEPSNPKEEATIVTTPSSSVSDEEFTKEYNNNTTGDASGKPVNSGQDFYYCIYLILILLSMVALIVFSKRKNN